jgi:hypothetical protein
MNTQNQQAQPQAQPTDIEALKQRLETLNQQIKQHPTRTGFEYDNLLYARQNVQYYIIDYNFRNASQILAKGGAQ